MLTYLPPEIVRKIFAYNIERDIDRYSTGIAKMYNIRIIPNNFQFTLSSGTTPHFESD